MILQRKVNMTEKLNILVVDDNQINRQYFSMALMKFGYSVTLAENGFEAIEQSKNKLFDLIFMDIRMPDMDGYETTNIIRCHELNKATPILAISAEEMPKENNQHFNGFILKPTSPRQLKQNVEKHCSFKNHKIEIFDKKQALSYAYNDDEIMQKLIAMFLNELPEQMKLLEYSIKSSNQHKCRQIIHKLMGSCQTCGAMALNEDLKKLSLLTDDNNRTAALENTKASALDFVNQFS